MKYVLVTGANGGMGKAVVDLLVKKGYRVFAADKEECPARENVIPLLFDVTDEKSAAGAFEAVGAVTDELCAIINLAGIYMLDSLVEITPRAFECAFRINLGGAFLVNRTFLPLLKSGARIITVTSELASSEPLPFTGLYAATKTALDRYCCSLRMELQLLGISVSVLRAGAVDTGMIEESTKQLDKFCNGTKLYSCNAKRFKDVVDRVESRRIPPEKLAGKIYGILTAKRPRFSYSINRSPLLALFGLLPERARFFVIRKILKK